MNKIEITLLPEVESLEMLLLRLPSNHPQRKYLETEHHRKSAGRRGEERVAHKMREFQMDDEHQYLRNICLAAGEWKVQMDGILLTKRGAIIIESKNISGQLHFNEETEEFFRIDSDGLKTVMDDPVVQLNKNIRFLTNFFRLHRIQLPVKGLVVFTAKQCEFFSKPRAHTVCKMYQMIDRLFDILQTFPQKSTRQNLSKIIKLFHKHAAPFERIPLCEQYFIDSNELRAGILCQSCKQHSVILKHKTGWVCMSCHEKNNDAIHSAIREYFSLVSHQLNNSRLREFCNLDSKYTVSRILTMYDLAISGESKKRVYEMKKNK